LIEPRVLGERLEFAVSTIRRISKQESLKIVLLGADATALPNVYRDAVLAKSYVPDTLRKSIAPFLSPPETAVWLAGIERDLATATEQTFGMMAGVELRAVDPSTATSSDMRVAITLTERPLGSDWLLSIECSDQLASSLTAALLGIDVTEAEPDRVSGLGEVLNVLAGRVKQCAHDVGRALDLGLPQVIDADRLKVLAPEPIFSIGFQWSGIEPFRVALFSQETSAN
jgi:CheY-specific phosphatase CheX